MYSFDGSLAVGRLHRSCSHLDLMVLDMAFKTWHHLIWITQLILRPCLGTSGIVPMELTIIRRILSKMNPAMS